MNGMNSNYRENSELPEVRTMMGQPRKDQEMPQGLWLALIDMLRKGKEDEALGQGIRPIQAAPGQDPRQAAPSAAPAGWGPPPNPNTRPGML
jgi:hypothetical protein